MIFEHEIPKGSRLYFGKIAKKKRGLETLVSEVLYANNFEEVITPNFSYSQHQSIENSRKLITIFDERNEKVALRADSTLDVVRIITKRLGRTTSHKKWFYIQPVFSYPSNEDYQIGCEWINHDSIVDIINLNAIVLNKLNINPIMQISNINIPRLVCNELNIDIELFQNAKLAELFSLNVEWLNILLNIKNKQNLEDALLVVPVTIKQELEKLMEVVLNINYKNIVIAPLYYGCMKYYDDIYYRVIQDNLTLCNGGSYKSEGLNSLGFALYTDNLLKVLED